MSASQPAGPESRAAPRRPPGGRWRRLARGLLALLAVVVTLGAALRLFLTDERLRRMTRDYIARHTGAAVELEALQVSLWSGVEARGFRLGPPPGFSRTPLALDRLAVHWSLWELARLRLVLPEIAVDGATVALERTGEGSNLELLLERLLARPAPERPPAPTGAPAGERRARLADLGELSLPVHIVVRRLEVTNLAVDVVESELAAHVDHVNVEGRLDGVGRDIELDLWAGLGERAAGGASSHLRLAGGTPPTDVEATTRLGVHLTAAGPSRVGLDVAFASRAHVARPYALPPVEASGSLRLSLDLDRGDVHLGECAWRVGRGTVVEASGDAQGLLSEAAAGRVTRLDATLDLDELAPLVAAVAPGTRVGGRVRLAVEPLAADLHALARRVVPRGLLVVELERVLYARGANRVADLGGTARVDAGGEPATLSAELHAAAVDAGGSWARGARLALRSSAPLDLLAGGEPAGSVAAHVVAGATEAGSTAGRVRALDLKLDADVPVGLLRGGGGTPPLTARVGLRAGAVDAAAGGADGVALAIDARAGDLRGERLDADVRLTTKAVRAAVGGELARLPGAELALSLGRSRDDYDVRRLALSLGELAALDAHGTVRSASSPRPILSGVHIGLAVPRLEAVLAALPAAARPPGAISGALTLELEPEGTVPLRELSELAAPPRVTSVGGGEAWRIALRAWADYLGRWAEWLDRGLPLTAATRVALRDVAFSDGTSEVRGLDGTTSLELGRHGPRWRLAADVGHVTGAATVEKGHLDLDLRAEGTALSLSAAGSAATVHAGALARPLAGARLAFSARYRLGGDLLVDDARFDEAGYGLHVEASGAVSRPFAIAYERGWERAGMPGVEASARLAAGLRVPGGLVPLTGPATAVAGSLGIEGSVHIARGLVAVRGGLDAQDFSYVTEPLAVEGVTGTLPFALDLVAGTRDDAVVLSRGAKLGGGVLSLVTSGEDVRDRPARPPYYDRLRPYRGRPGLSVARLRKGGDQATDLHVDGRIDSGMFIADRLSLGVLGGDVVGNLALQLSREGSLVGDVLLRLSGIDASNFHGLELRPGPDSRLDASLGLRFLFAPRKRDLGMSMSVTRCGTETFDRFLRWLDPEGTDERIQSARDNLRWIHIRGIAIWVRRENLNVDLAYRTFVPWWSPIEPELVRRNSLSEYLNTYVQPWVDLYVARPLGWSHDR